MEEIYKDIDGYEGLYRVSNMGNLMSLPRVVTDSKGIVVNIKKLSYIKPSMAWGYKKYALHKNKAIKSMLAHRLVAIAFIPNENNYPVVNHIDGNKVNNRVDNLEWCTHKENTQHALKTGLAKKAFGETHSSAKLKIQEVLDIRKALSEKSETQTSLGIKYGVAQQVIYNIKIRRIWKHI